MSNQDYSKIQLLDDNDDSDDDLMLPAASSDLKFQDFSGTSNIPLDDGTSKPLATLSTNILLSDDDEDDNDDDRNGSKNARKELLSNKNSPSFWSFEYYQSFFDVDTSQVVSRMGYSMFPNKDNYLLTKIRPNPDLYGPFWICTTLVFTIAICGNLSSYFVSEGTHKWKSDFRLVSLSAAVIFTYAWLVPTSLWAFLFWKSQQRSFSYLEIVCVYGYSLAVFIPISIFWIIPYDWVRWVLVFTGALASGSVLTITFWPAFEEYPKKTSLILCAVILVFHTVLAIGFKLYFFNSNKIHESVLATNSTVT